MSDTNQQTEPTPEQIEEFKKKRMAYYKAELPLLRQQEEFERLVANIEESRTRAMTMRIRYAEMTAPPDKDPNEAVKDPATPSEGRKLKTE